VDVDVLLVFLLSPQRLGVSSLLHQLLYFLTRSSLYGSRIIIATLSVGLLALDDVPETVVLVASEETDPHKLKEGDPLKSLNLLLLNREGLRLLLPHLSASRLQSLQQFFHFAQ
jgi:hypothetical protein